MAHSYTPDILRQRTKRFALTIIKLYKSLPRIEEARIHKKAIDDLGLLIDDRLKPSCMDA